MNASGFGADRFGWTDDALAKVRARRGWTEQAIEQLELEWDDRGARPVGIPVRDATADRVGTIRYDPFGRAHPKMLAEAGATRELFPPPETIPNGVGALLITEGEPDAVACYSHGFVAVGVPGVSGWQREYVGRFSGRPETFYVVGDCDTTGRLFTRTAAGDLATGGIDVRIVDLDPTRDDGYDLTDYLLEHGGEGLSLV